MKLRMLESKNVSYLCSIAICNPVICFLAGDTLDSLRNKGGELKS